MPENLEKNLTVVEKTGLAKIKQGDTAARLVPHYNWITASLPLSREEKTKVEEHEHPLLAATVLLEKCSWLMLLVMETAPTRV